MKPIYFRLLLMLTVFSFLFISCNSGEKDSSSENIVPIQDAVTAAPSLYSVLADTMGIRIIEVNYKSGDTSVMHKHSDLAVYVVEGGTNTFTMKDGTVEVREVPAGASFVMPAQTHSVKNTGETTLKAILFEVNRSGTISAADPAADASSVSPELYKVTADTLGIRINEVVYGPGQSSPMHMHPDNAIYVVEGGQVEFTLKDGTKTVSELPAGAAMIRPAEAHAAKNTGKNSIKVILVEVRKK